MNEDIFKFLTPQDRTRFLEHSQNIKVDRDKVILKQDDKDHNLYLIRSGYVRVEREGDGHNVAFARLGPGEVFGEMSFLDQGAASASVVADEEVTYDLVQYKFLQPLLVSDPGFAARFYQSLAVCLTGRLRLTSSARLAGMLREEALLRRFHLERTGQVTEKQMPADLVKAVASFKKSLEKLAQEVRGRRLKPEAAQPSVEEACNALCGILEQYTTDESLLLEVAADDPLGFRDSEAVALGIGGYVFRETFSLFTASATMARCYMKPHGYVEDRETLELIYQDEAAGDGTLGPLLDRWFLGRPICQARRNTQHRLAALLKDAAAGFQGPRPFRVTSMGCGAVTELFGMMAASPAGGVYATCIDVDEMKEQKRLARDKGLANQFTFLTNDPVALAAGQGKVDLLPQHLIYALNLCDYATDEQLSRLIAWMTQHLADAGQIVLINLDVALPDGAFRKHILEWKMIGRTEQELREVCSRAGLSITVTRDESGMAMLATGRKK